MLGELGYKEVGVGLARGAGMQGGGGGWGWSEMCVAWRGVQSFAENFFHVMKVSSLCRYYYFSEDTTDPEGPHAYQVCSRIVGVAYCGMVGVAYSDTVGVAYSDTVGVAYSGCVMKWVWHAG